MSRALTAAERHYSQFDKEALAMVFAVRKFHQYVYGREFILETDHKPLTHIFGDKKGLPQVAASRVQRWAVFLSGYNFKIKHIKGKDNIPADVLSRILRKDVTDDFKNCLEYSYLNYVCENSSAIDSKVVEIETEKDAVLRKVKEFVIKGWPNTVDENLRAFKVGKLELTIESGCVMWGYRVIVPVTLREKVLNELHDAHMGIVKMKALARSYVWWTNLDRDLENVTKTCWYCLKNADNPPKARLHPWAWPEHANERIHADFCGSINNYMYIVIIDAHSKWVDVAELRDITADTTMKIM